MTFNFILDRPLCASLHLSFPGLEVSKAPEVNTMRIYERHYSSKILLQAQTTLRCEEISL